VDQPSSHTVAPRHLRPPGHRPRLSPPSRARNPVAPSSVETASLTTCHRLATSCGSVFPIRRRHLLYSPERVQLSPSVVAATAAQRRGGAGVSAGACWTPVSVWQKTTLPPEATATGGGALPASRIGTVGDARATAMAVCNNRLACPRSRELAAAWRLQCVPRRPLAWTRRHASGRGERRCCRPTPGLAAQSNGPLSSSASASMAASRCATRTGANTSSASYAYHCCHTSKKREVQRTALERAALSSFVLDWSAVAHLEHNHQRRFLLHTNLNSGATCDSLSGERTYVKAVRRSQADRDRGPRGLTSTRGLHIFQRGRLELGMGGRNRSHIRLTPVLTTCTSFSNSGLSGIFTVFTYEIGFRGLRQTRYTSLPAFL